MRRLLYLPHSEAAEEEVRSARERGHGAHRLAFIEAVFNFEQGYYRFDAKHISTLSSLLLRAARGPPPLPGSPSAAAAAAQQQQLYHDTPATLARLAHTLCPAYATADACASHPMLHAGVLPMPEAPLAAHLGAMIYADLQVLPPALSVLAAEEGFMAIVRENPCYGADMFLAQRVWEVAAEEEGGVGGGGAAGGAAAAPPEERVEHVLVCIGHSGATIISQAQPLEAQLMVEFENILHFASDGSLFLMNVLEPSDFSHHASSSPSPSSSSSAPPAAGAPPGKAETMVYILTPAADALAASVERYMRARAAAEEVGGLHGGSTLPVPPRSARTLGAIPVLTQIVVAPRPEGRGGGREGGEGGGGGGGAGGDLFSAAGTGDQLPPGWLAASDADGDVFYYHSLSKVTTWDHPGRPTGPLPEGWCEVADPMDARRYFFCPATRAVTWTRPGTAPSSSSGSSSAVLSLSGGPSLGSASPGSPQLQQQVAAQTFTLGEATARQQQGGGGGAALDASALVAQERQLPRGWSLAFDSSDGTPYYFTLQGRTQWELPTLPAS